MTDADARIPAAVRDRLTEEEERELDAELRHRLGRNVEQVE